MTHGRELTFTHPLNLLKIWKCMRKKKDKTKWSMKKTSIAILYRDFS